MPRENTCRCNIASISVDARTQIGQVSNKYVRTETVSAYCSWRTGTCKTSKGHHSRTNRTKRRREYSTSTEWTPTGHLPDNGSTPSLAPSFRLSQPNAPYNCYEIQKI